MSSKLPRISDFEWASVAQYIAWAEMYLGLAQISTSQIYSFRIGMGGMGPLEAKKVAQLRVVRDNKKKIETYAGGDRTSHEPAELAVLRSMYVSLNVLDGVLVDQIATCKASARRVEQSGIGEVTGGS